MNGSLFIILGRNGSLTKRSGLSANEKLDFTNFFVLFFSRFKLEYLIVSVRLKFQEGSIPLRKRAIMLAKILRGARL